MNRHKRLMASALTLLVVLAPIFIPRAIAADAQKPNIIFIMADDIGWFNTWRSISQGMMAGRSAQSRQTSG